MPFNGVVTEILINGASKAFHACALKQGRRSADTAGGPGGPLPQGQPPLSPAVSPQTGEAAPAGSPLYRAASPRRWLFAALPICLRAGASALGRPARAARPSPARLSPLLSPSLATSCRRDSPPLLAFPAPRKPGASLWPGPRPRVPRAKCQRGTGSFPLTPPRQLTGTRRLRPEPPRFPPKSPGRAFLSSGSAGRGCSGNPGATSSHPPRNQRGAGKCSRERGKINE